MKALLLEFIKDHNQVEQFKTWLIEQGIDTEGGVEAWVDSEFKDLY
ncbi:hypothetical protein V8G56_16040 [Gaetbulibacter aquiaggeris]|uniref:Uncharacterized protein n=1 Tax=Gaetbulibacter aquiaggeris TaxID=1735373 RepID=A0ABW7MTT7_9FLAO